VNVERRAVESDDVVIFVILSRERRTEAAIRADDYNFQ